jgi:hypothetical protein
MGSMASLAAIGLRLHSGWASAVLMAQDPEGASGLIARRRIMLCERPQAKQPYHAAENMKFTEAEAFIAECRKAAIALTVEAVRRLGSESGGRKLAGIGLTASAARELPALSSILHSHALIHAAEGVFYRDAVIEAARRLGIKARAITNRAAPEFLDGARDLREVLERIGKMAGPPWTMDEKCASLAAFSLLPGIARKFRLGKLGETIH